MKKSYKIALVFIILAVVGIIAYYFISTYGPGSERAQIKKRVEYVLEGGTGLSKGLGDRLGCIIRDAIYGQFGEEDLRCIAAGI